MSGTSVFHSAQCVTIATTSSIECSTEKGSKPASYKSQGALRLEILQFEWNHNLKYDKRVDHRNILNGPPVTIMHVLASWLNGIECSTQSQGTDCSNSNTTPTRYARAYPPIRLYPSTAARVLRLLRHYTLPPNRHWLPSASHSMTRPMTVLGTWGKCVVYVTWPKESNFNSFKILYPILS